jgi:hypothetical protein
MDTNKDHEYTRMDTDNLRPGRSAVKLCLTLASLADVAKGGDERLVRHSFSGGGSLLSGFA